MTVLGFYYTVVIFGVNHIVSEKDSSKVWLELELLPFSCFIFCSDQECYRGFKQVASKRPASQKVCALWICPEMSLAFHATAMICLSTKVCMQNMALPDPFGGFTGNDTGTFVSWNCS